MNRIAEMTPRPSLNPLPAIFAVDDDEGDRLLFLRAVGEAKLPYPCRLFTAGEHLLDALIDVLRGAAAPVVCFIDVKMAGMSGLDVLRWIRAQHALDAMPVVMLSSSDHPENLAEAHQFGAQCYIAKFPPADQLREIITSAERYFTAAHGGSAFSVACNLLHGETVS